MKPRTENVVYVTAAGFTGSGKSAVLGEIEIALKAIGLKVEYAKPIETQHEKNMIHAEWMDALELYRPRIVLGEKNWGTS